MAATINTKIQLRTDIKSNWESANPVLKLGEIAIVCFDNDYKDIKIGNGISSFNQLSYLYQNAISAESITGKDLHVKSIAQGYNVTATPTSLATGIFSYADGNFDVVHGIEAQAKTGDDYAFVFNGKNLPLDGENFYISHGEGTFNINPKDGLSGFYIGEYSAAAILSNYFLSNEISNYYDKTYVNGLWLDLNNKIIVVDNELSDYYKKTETSSSNEISTAVDSINATIAVEVAARSDADDVIINKVDTLSNSLSDYYTKSETSCTTELNTKFNNIYVKTETSSANEISIAFDNKVKIGNYVNGSYNLSSSDLSVVRITADDYYKLVSEEKQNDKVVYVLCSDNINAHDQTIINVAEPELSNDAATKNYVDVKVSTISLSDYWKKSETSSNIEISTAILRLSSSIPTNVSQLANDVGYTTNIGTITGITMNGSSKGSSGNVDLGTVLTGIAQATSSDFGGIKANYALSTDTQEVHISSDGKLYTRASVLKIRRLADNGFRFIAQQANSTITFGQVDGDRYLSSTTGLDGSWSDYSGGIITLANIGDKVYFKIATANSTFCRSADASNPGIIITGKVAASGNIQYLLTSDGKRTDLSMRCYNYMFSNCSALTQAPELPATTLDYQCYQYMFLGCTSLTSAPELPATTLADRCYSYIFSGCTKFSDCHMKASMQGIYNTSTHGDTTKTVIYDL